MTIPLWIQRWFLSFPAELTKTEKGGSQTPPSHDPTSPPPLGPGPLPATFPPKVRPSVEQIQLLLLSLTLRQEGWLRQSLPSPLPQMLK